MLNHRIKYSQELSHAGSQGEFFGLALGTEPLVKGSDDGIAAGGGDQGCHVKRTSDSPMPSPDRAFASHQSTVTVERSYPC
jgi:hypothetical protein